MSNSSSEEDNKRQQEQKRPDDNSSERKKQREEKDVNYSLQQGIDFLAVNFIHTPAFGPATERK